VIVGREFLITGLRSYAATCGRVISAHVWGKGKAAITMVAIAGVLTAAGGRAGGFLAGVMSHADWNRAYTTAAWLLGISAVLTIVSGGRYVVDAWPLLRQAPAGDEIPAERRPRIAAGGDRTG
jgi:CDP-diacylglycerol---glycerol-3-phosphate 3-phosphatidyltransferase